MSDDNSNSAALRIAQTNVRKNVEQVLLEQMNDLLSRVCERSGESNKMLRKRPNLVLRAFQEEMQKYSDSERELFHESIQRKCPYIKELLSQITKMQVLILSRIRNSRCSHIEVEEPNLANFLDNLLKLNRFSIFHNVELFWQQYLKRNPGLFSDIVNANTDRVLNDSITSAYTKLFNAPVPQQCASVLDEAIKQANNGKEVEKRDIPIIAHERIQDAKASKESKEPKSEKPNETRTVDVSGLAGGGVFSPVRKDSSPVAKDVYSAATLRQTLEEEDGGGRSPTSGATPVTEAPRTPKTPRSPSNASWGSARFRRPPEFTKISHEEGGDDPEIDLLTNFEDV